MTVAMFAVDADARTARGILLPFNQMSRESMSKTKPLRFAKGDVRIPRDPAIVTLNLDHDRFQPIGRATYLEEREEGVYAEFSIASTDEGDEWLADHSERAMLSAEVRDIHRKKDDWATAFITGAASVPEGAFEGAALFSLHVEGAPETPAKVGEEGPDVGGDEDPDQNPDRVVEVPPETTDPAPAETDEEPDAEPDENEEEDAVAEATAPAETMLATRQPTKSSTDLSARGFFSAYRQARTTGDFSVMRPYIEQAESMGLFALTDVKYDGTGGLNLNNQITGPAYLGELWQGRRFQRTIVPLLTQGVLTNLSATGWIWSTKPIMDAWAGNKTAVPSNTPVVAPKNFAAQRFAGGHDLAREFYDFNVTEVIDSYVAAMIDSYALLSDTHALTNLVSGAVAFTPGAVTATPNKQLLTIIDGALAVVAAQATPSFAIVAPDVFRGIINTPQSSAMEYFDAAIGIDGGSTSGFKIIPDARLAAGQVLVGAKEAATAWELPGVPIRVSAQDLVKGGIDEAFFGYIAVGITYPQAIVKALVP
jgi:hypothetical protein